jgi:hypothetical protein
MSDKHKVALGLLGFVILIVITGLVLKSDNNNLDSVACTQEALICPDGSGVGREGPQCEFSACVGNGPYVGVLEQSSDGLRLVMEPENESVPQEYVLPIEIKITNALKDLVETRVSVIGAFTVGNTFQVESLKPATQTDLTTTTLSVGDTSTINGVKITLNNVVEDFRCSIDEDCMELGGINVNVTLESEGDIKTINLPSDQAPMSFGGYSISIIDIQPDKELNVPISENDYKVTFQVTK